MKRCSYCSFPNPKAKHKCFRWGLGRAKDSEPNPNCLSERLLRRIKKEFPDDVEYMTGEERPKREHGKGGMWSWCYWPHYACCIGSPYTMKECLAAERWIIYHERSGEQTILLPDKELMPK